MRVYERFPLAHLPTPIEPLSRLSATLGGPTLLVKRDDQTGLALGGNKTRKLEYLLADARSHGARTLVTAGAVQSNHCRQTAAAAARAGMECILVLTGHSPSRATGNLALDHLFAAEIVWTAPTSRDSTLEQTYQQAAAENRQPYLIPYGGSNSIGARAYAIALQELLEQGVSPDWIIFATSSGGTQAGLLAGARLFGFQGRILGISVDEPAEVLKARIAKLASETIVEMGRTESITTSDVLVNADYLGGGYAVMGDDELNAIQLFARMEGLLLDPVYTGRAAAGLIDLISKGAFTRQETVLFWHTGGIPALFVDAYSDQFQP